MIEYGIPGIAIVVGIIITAAVLWPRKQLCYVCGKNTQGTSRVKAEGGYTHLSCWKAVGKSLDA